MGDSPVVPVPLPSVSGTIGPVQVAGQNVTVVYHGITVRETMGSTAVIKLYDSAATSGTIVLTVALAANASYNEPTTTYGVRVKGGLYYQLVSGTVEGSVRIA